MNAGFGDDAERAVGSTSGASFTSGRVQHPSTFHRQSQETLRRTPSSDSASTATPTATPDRIRWLFDSASARDKPPVGPTGGAAIRRRGDAHSPRGSSIAQLAQVTSRPVGRSPSSESASLREQLAYSRPNNNFSLPSSVLQSPARTGFVTPQHAHSASLTRTISANSSASTTSSDYPPTPRAPLITDRWSRSDGGALTKTNSNDHKRGKGVVMVDPRFSFLQRNNNRKSTGPLINHVGGENMARTGSFVASLGLAPLVDTDGNQIPLYPARRMSSPHLGLQNVGENDLLHEVELHPTPPQPGLLAAFNPTPPTQTPTPPTAPPRDTRDSTPSPTPSSPRRKPKTIFKSAARHRRRKSATFAGSPKAFSSPDLRALAIGQSPNPTHQRLNYHRDAGALPPSLCEAFTFPKPRIVALSPPTSPQQERSSFISRRRSASSPPAAFNRPKAKTKDKAKQKEKDKGKGKQKVEPKSFLIFDDSDADDDDDEMEEIASIRGGYASSVRRVLRENEESRREREEWSDSSTGGSLADWAVRRRLPRKKKEERPRKEKQPAQRGEEKENAGEMSDKSRAPTGRPKLFSKKSQHLGP